MRLATHLLRVLTGTQYAIDVFYSEGHTNLDDYASWLELKIDSFGSGGFKCIIDEISGSTKIITIDTPLEKLLKEEDILKCLDKPEVGNVFQINALHAWQYLQFARAFWEED